MLDGDRCWPSAPWPLAVGAGGVLGRRRQQPGRRPRPARPRRPPRRPPPPHRHDGAAPTTTTLATGPADLGAPSVTAAQTTSADGTGAIDPTLQAQITDAVHTYVNAATGTPLGTGQAAVLDGVLTAAAAGRLTAASRDALTDEGLPALAGVKADHANVAIDAFVGPDQSMVVNAVIDVAVPATEAGGRRR